ncbi:hypothetical protein ACFLYR_02765, partial [Chloroflexota bacterium]
ALLGSSLSAISGRCGGKMSQFIDKLNRVSQVGPQSMGFRATSAARSKPKMLLIASLAQADLNSLAGSVAGADAGLLSVSEMDSGAGTIKKAIESASDIPWGVWLEDVGSGGVTEIVGAGCDFMVFPSVSSVMAIPEGDVAGRILELELSLGDGLLRAIDKLPLDAVLIGGEQKEGRSLTWQHLMYFQRCADLVTKPLLAAISANMTAAELQALWVAGVGGLVVGVGAGQPAGRLMELRQAIDSLVFPLPSKRGKLAALVPSVGGRESTVTEEPEEE